MKSKIFLAGSTSYVGTKFIELYGSKFNILGAARTSTIHSVDLLNYAALEKLFVNFQPDFVLNLAANVGRDSTTSNAIIVTNSTMTKNLIDLALTNKTPFLFTSTEAVYGSKENIGGYIETDVYKPRSPYGASKVESEKLLIKSGLPYLITRGHRHVGISKSFKRPKQFPDALRHLTNGQIAHFDSRKLFTPVLINNICDIFAHYIANDAGKQILINVGVDSATTFYDFMVDVARELGLSKNLVQPDGEETGWPVNSSLSIEKLHKLQYPSVTHEEVLNIIRADNI